MSKEFWKHWLGGLVITPILLFAAWLLLGLISLPFFTWETLVFASVTVAFYLFALLTQNRIESIIVWIIVVILLLPTPIVYRKLQLLKQRMANLEASPKGTATAAHESIRPGLCTPI